MQNKKSKVKRNSKRAQSQVNIGDRDLGKEEFIANFKKLIDKLTLALSQKFFSLFKEKGYDINQLQNDLNKICMDVDFNNLEYTLLFVDTERKILKKVNKLPYLSHKGVPDTEKVGSYLTEPIKVSNKVLEHSSAKQQPKAETVSERTQNKHNHLQGKKDQEKVVTASCSHLNAARPKTSTGLNKPVSLNEDEEIALQRALKKEKLNKLKAKQTDEWALIAKYNHYKKCVEERNKLVDDKQRKEGFTSTLQRQISEKELAKRNLRSLEEKFFEVQKEKLKRAEEEENRVKEEKKIKIAREREILDSQTKMKKATKEKKREEEKSREKILIDKVKEEIKHEEIKINDKKVKERQNLQEIIEASREKAERISKKKEDERQLNKRCIEEYTKILDKQDEEREKLKKTIKDKYFDNTDFEKDQKARADKEVIEKYNSNKYHKEREEIDTRLKDDDIKKNNQKQEMIESMKRTLDQQIQDKRKKFDLEKEYHSRFNDTVVRKSVEKFYSDQKDNEQKQKDMIERYKEELDKQLLAKNQRAQGAMSEKEKAYNKRLLEEIYSSPMMN